MDLILSENEEVQKEWGFIDRESNLEFQSSVVVTNKRFIYHKELANSKLQSYVDRFDVGLKNIKAVASSYGTRQNKFWLILGIVGIVFFLMSIGLFTASQVETGVVLCIVGIAMAIGGFYFNFNPDKSPIKIKNPNVSVRIETNTPEGSIYGLGAGKSIVLKGKKAYSPVVLVLLTLCGIFPGVIYYFAKKKNSSDGLEMPQAVAVELIETLGSLIF